MNKVTEDNISIEKEKNLARILLIDLENCPSQINQLMKDLEVYSKIVVCYAQSGAKIPIDWLIPLTSAVNDNKLRLIKMPNGGKNAADFGITFWAGVLMNQLPEADFTIVSNDSDLDHVVNILISEQRNAERIGLKNENNQTVEPINSTIINQDQQIREYCAHLLNHNKNRPAKKETLINNIKSKFKDNAAVIPDEIYNRLVKNGIILFKEGSAKVNYNDQKISSLAKAS